MYAWKDPNSGQSKFSNIAPPWYHRGEQVSGPRVIQTLGGKVVDDTALPYERRLLLSGKSQDYIDKLRLEKSQVHRPPGESVHESASSDAGSPGMHSANMMPTHGAALKRKKG